MSKFVNYKKVIQTVVVLVLFIFNSVSFSSDLNSSNEAQKNESNNSWTIPGLQFTLRIPYNQDSIFDLNPPSNNHPLQIDVSSFLLNSEQQLNSTLIKNLLSHYNINNGGNSNSTNSGRLFSIDLLTNNGSDLTSSENPKHFNLNYKVNEFTSNIPEDNKIFISLNPEELKSIKFDSSKGSNSFLDPFYKTENKWEKKEFDFEETSKISLNSKRNFTDKFLDTYHNAKNYIVQNKLNVQLTVLRFLVNGTFVTFGFVLSDSQRDSRIPFSSALTVGIATGFLSGGFQLKSDALKRWLEGGIEGNAVNKNPNLDKSQNRSSLVFDKFMKKASFYTKYALMEFSFLTILNALMYKLEMYPPHLSNIDILMSVLGATIKGVATQGLFYSTLFDLTNRLKEKFPDKLKSIDNLRYVSTFLGSAIVVTTSVVFKSLNIEFADFGYLFLGSAGLTFYALSTRVEKNSKAVVSFFEKKLNLKSNESNRALNCSSIFKSN